MNKHSLIVIIASVVIAGTLIYSFVNIIGLNDIQMRWYQKDGFDYLAMMAGGKIELCNPTSVPMNVKQVEIQVTYQGNELGKLTSEGMTLFPSKTEDMTAKVEMNDQTGQVFLMYLDTELSGNDLARFDPNQMRVNVIYETKFLGFIPYSVSKSYLGAEFENIMNQREGTFSCN